MFSKIPKGMCVDVEDLDLFNTDDWTIKHMEAPIEVKTKVNMPWCTVPQNLFYESKSGDKAPINYRFPHIQTLYATGTGTDDYSEKVISNPDSKNNLTFFMQEPETYKDFENPKQSMVTNEQPFGNSFCEFLIKPVPYSDIVNKPINYFTEFYATYSIDISVRAAPLLYKTPRQYAHVANRKHWAAKRDYGIGNVITKYQRTKPDE